MPALFNKVLPKIRLSSKKILLCPLFVFVFSVSATASYLYLSLRQVSVGAQKPAQPQTIPQPASPPDATTSYNVLLLGYGGAGHEGGTLTDSIIIANLKPKEKKLALISVPRDLWVEIPIRSDIKQGFKINHAYAIGLDDAKYPLKQPQYKGEEGAAHLTKEVVADAVGMPIDYFVAVDFEGFKNIIDILGGVDVEVPVTFNDYFYPIKGRENDTCGKSADEIAELHELYSDTELHHQFECRYEHIHFDAGKTSMDEETALKFVRSRASAQHGGDFARNQRQQAVLVGVKDKLISMDAIKKIDELFNQLEEMVRTDLDLKIVKDLVLILGNPEDYEVRFVSLSEENVLVSSKSLNGQSILLPKEGEGVWNGIHSFVEEQIQGRN